jgi:uncharacterized protein YcbK (DUF882 family)
MGNDTPSPWKYFSLEELRCSCGCRQMLMDQGFMEDLVKIRKELGFGLYVTSGYRCYNHPVEINKNNRGGPHTTGKAVDIMITGSDAVKFLESALKHNMKGFGFQQKGSKTRFIHIDQLEPRMWSY